MPEPATMLAAHLVKSAVDAPQQAKSMKHKMDAFRSRGGSYARFKSDPEGYLEQLVRALSEFATEMGDIPLAARKINITAPSAAKVNDLIYVFIDNVIEKGKSVKKKVLVRVPPSLTADRNFIADVPTVLAQDKIRVLGAKLHDSFLDKGETSQVSAQPLMGETNEHNPQQYNRLFASNGRPPAGGGANKRKSKTRKSKTRKSKTRKYKTRKYKTHE